MAKQKKTNETPNVALEIGSFDYAKLQGEDFASYQKIERTLLMNEKYDYEMWLATSQIKFKMDEDTGEKIAYMNGIILHGNKPIQISRMTAAQARELNSHVKSGAAERQNSKYYLLVQAKPELTEDKA